MSFRAGHGLAPVHGRRLLVDPPQRGSWRGQPRLLDRCGHTVEQLTRDEIREDSRRRIHDGLSLLGPAHEASGDAGTLCEDSQPLYCQLTRSRSVSSGSSSRRPGTEPKPNRAGKADTSTTPNGMNSSKIPVTSGAARPGTGWPATMSPWFQVSWNDAVEFCRWLSKTEGRAYRLPHRGRVGVCVPGEGAWPVVHRRRCQSPRGLCLDRG